MNSSSTHEAHNSEVASDLEAATARLAAWCRAHDFAGFDPFDGLNSQVFQSTPFIRSRTARLAWTQLFKRSPLNLRTLARVPKGRNPKGTALFALAALARFRRTRGEDAANEARTLLDSLIAARITVGDGAAAWGYNFDWQGRAFFAPKGTPTIVPTAFAARALIEAWREFEDETHLEQARAACRFITHRLPRSVETPNEICFAYSPLDRTQVFNASLLAAETLAEVAIEINDENLCELAARAARYVVHRQAADGRWAYGAADYQSWADNFHTAYLLSSLLRIRRCLDTFQHPTADITASIERGDTFWRANFFDPDGRPKYYPAQAFPVDAHSAGASLVTLSEMRDRQFANKRNYLSEPPAVAGGLPFSSLRPPATAGGSDKSALPFATRVANWTITNMQDARGFFHYQIHRRYTNRIPYMRWSQSWMLYGLEKMLEARCQMSAKTQAALLTSELTSDI